MIQEKNKYKNKSRKVFIWVTYQLWQNTKHELMELYSK